MAKMTRKTVTIQTDPYRLNCALDDCHQEAYVSSCAR